MALQSNSNFGIYRIGDVIGEGGMGQVYRATDTTLDREVAIKVLPESFASDAERVSRFEREAKTLASLNHPNIAQIYGLEKQGDTTAIVMELVEGPTLADRIAEGPLDPEEAMRIAMQLVDGLEAAHERGVVHRDLKPANIKINEGGLVKILDFGIAKSIDFRSASGGHSVSMMTPAVTQTGIIMGTAAYMSPEQARGKFVDQRTDVWAFGCVLYEMLTGQPAFAGEDVAVTLARIIANDTDMESIPGAISPLVRHTLGMCLQKDPKNRIHHIGDVRLAIKGEFEIGVGRSGATSGARRRWAAAAIAFAAVAGGAAWWLKPVPEPEAGEVVRFNFSLDEAVVPRNSGRNVVDISWDGRQIIYNTNQGIVIRDLADNVDRPLPGTQQPLTNPLFSPDGQWIAFWDGQLKKIPATGGSAVVLADFDNPQGANWHADGSRIVTADINNIYEIPANGGEPQMLLSLDDGFPWDPQYLPNDDILFTRRGAVNNWTIEVWRPGTQAPEVLFPGERAIYIATGHLIATDPLTSPAALFARSFDLQTHAVGGPVPVAENVALANNRTHFALSPAGHLVSFFGVGIQGPTGSMPDLQLTVTDRDGRQRTLGAPPRPYRSPRISPDGTQLAVEIRSPDDTSSSIWIYDMSEETDIRRLTQVTQGNNMRPVWTPDSESIAFMSDRDGPGSIYLQPADGSAPAERLTTAEDGTFHLPESWAPDGSLSFALLTGNFSATSWGIYTRDPQGEIAAFHALDTSNQFGSTFSPDGQWLAYSSGEDTTDATQFRVYVERYPKSGERYEVAVGGALFPAYSADGSEIFFRRGINNESRRLNSVNILETEPRFRFSSAGSVDIRGFQNYANYRDYDPLPDGTGWVMLTDIDSDVEPDTATAPAAPEEIRIDVVLNWFEEVKERVPTE